MPDFEEIATIYDPEEAWVVRSVLQAQGIDATLSNAEAMAVMPLYRIAFGGHRLLVPEDRASEARTLLAATTKDKPVNGFEYDDVTCPDCGNSYFTRVKPWLLPMVLLLALGIPLWWNAKQLRCVACGGVTRDRSL